MNEGNEGVGTQGFEVHFVGLNGRLEACFKRLSG